MGRGFSACGLYVVGTHYAQLGLLYVHNTHGKGGSDMATDPMNFSPMHPIYFPPGPRAFYRCVSSEELLRESAVRAGRECAAASGSAADSRLRTPEGWE